MKSQAAVDQVWSVRQGIHPGIERGKGRKSLPCSGSGSGDGDGDGAARSFLPSLGDGDGRACRMVRGWVDG